MTNDNKKRTTRFEERLKKILDEDVNEVIDNIKKKKSSSNISSSKKGKYNGENKTDI